MNAQVIIVGGGVIGAACAYFLSCRRVEVLVLEGCHLGSGASGATAAIISIRNGMIDRVVTDQGDYQADWVVVAAGAHTPRLLSSTAIEIWHSTASD